MRDTENRLRAPALAGQSVERRWRNQPWLSFPCEVWVSTPTKSRRGGQTTRTRFQRRMKQQTPRRWSHRPRVFESGHDRHSPAAPTQVKKRKVDCRHDEWNELSDRQRIDLAAADVPRGAGQPSASVQESCSWKQWKVGSVLNGNSVSSPRRDSQHLSQKRSSGHNSPTAATEMEPRAVGASAFDRVAASGYSPNDSVL